jgi:hypothetical protein
MKMTNLNKFDTHESFYHGLVKSKLWLCEELETAMYRECISKPTLHILGCWDNLLAFMLLTRKPEYYNSVYGYDIDPEAITNANKVCDMWKYESPKVTNIIQDVNDTDYSTHTNSIFINCSIDQMDSNNWYNSVPKGSLVCIQTTNMTDTGFPWYIKQTTDSLSELVDRFNLSNLLYSGVKNINYETNGYKRYMIIGTK